MRTKCCILALITLATTATAYKKPEREGSAVIHHAVEASDIWSTGSVHLKLRVKFMEVKSGEIEGEYEKIWISPKQWRASFTSTQFNSTSIGGDEQVWESADAPEKPLRVREFERALAALSQTVVNAGLKYSIKEIPARDKKTNLICAQVDDKQRSLVQDCVDPDTGLMLQIREPQADWAYTYSNYKPFAGKQFPQTIGVIEGTKAVAIAEVVQLEALTSVEAHKFDPPEGVESYRACPQALGLPLGASGGKLVKRVEPKRRFQRQGRPIIYYGTTVFAVVGRDGTLQTPVTLGGNAYLGAEEILEAIRQWRYEPFLVCGNPVEMPTSISVDLN